LGDDGEGVDGVMENKVEMERKVSELVGRKEEAAEVLTSGSSDAVTSFSELHFSFGYLQRTYYFSLLSSFAFIHQL
jgi:hypothetical protein